MPEVTWSFEEHMKLAISHHTVKVLLDMDAKPSSTEQLTATSVHSVILGSSARN